MVINFSLLLTFDQILSLRVRDQVNVLEYYIIYESHKEYEIYTCIVKYIQICLE